MTTTTKNPIELEWHPSLFGHNRVAWLDDEHTISVTELAPFRSVPALYLLRQSLRRGRAVVEWSASYPTLEAALHDIVVVGANPEA